jgi:hypothetical protein
MVLYLCVLIVFLLHQEVLKFILIDEPPPRGGSVIGSPKMMVKCDYHWEPILHPGCRGQF